MQDRFPESLLELNHVGSRRTLGAVDNIKTDGRSLVQGLVPIGLDGGMVDKDVRPFFLLDETKTL